MKFIKSLTEDEDFKNPTTYDLKITKSGEGFQTEYAILVGIPKPATPEIIEAYKIEKVNLQAIFYG